MAEEEKAPPAEAAKAGGAGEGAPKQSFLQKILAKPIFLIVILVVMMGAAGGITAFLMNKKIKATEAASQAALQAAKKAAAEALKKSHEAAASNAEPLPGDPSSSGEHAPSEEGHSQLADHGSALPEPQGAEAQTPEQKPEEPAAHEKPAEEAAPAAEGHGGGGGGGGEGHGEGGGGGGGEQGTMVKFEQIVLNVVEKNSLLYLKLQLTLQGSNVGVVEEVRARTPELRDNLLFLINDMTLREILSSGGKTLLKEDIISSFNKILKNGKIEKVYFTDFTVQ